MKVANVVILTQDEFMNKLVEWLAFTMETKEVREDILRGKMGAMGELYNGTLLKIGIEKLIELDDCTGIFDCLADEIEKRTRGECVAIYIQTNENALVLWRTLSKP